jgi:hypothetical protein
MIGLITTGLIDPSGDPAQGHVLSAAYIDETAINSGRAWLPLTTGNY